MSKLVKEFIWPLGQYKFLFIQIFIKIYDFKFYLFNIYVVCSTIFIKISSKLLVLVFIKFDFCVRNEPQLNFCTLHQLKMGI